MPSDAPTPNDSGTILDTIIEHKKTEVAERKVRVPLQELKARIAGASPIRGFHRALRASKALPATFDGFVDFSRDVENEEEVALIAEVKKASPSAGVIRADFDPVSIARIYEDNGAACLSVLTDERFFQGHDDYFRAVRHAVSIPMIRKDFTIDPYQIYETRVLGADAILLIAAALTADQIQEFLGIADEVGLDALVEVHTEEEMEIAVAAEASLVGINSRDLKRFVTDLAIFERLAPLAPAGSTLVAESGIRTPADVARVRRAGAHAILVGESLMRQPNIGEAVRELIG